MGKSWVCMKKFTLMSTLGFQEGLEAKDVILFKKGLTKGTSMPQDL